MPIVTAAVAAIGTFIGGISISSLILNAAVGVGLSFLAQALGGRPEMPGQEAFGVQGTLEAGGDVPRSFLFGYCTTAGSLVYANTWGEAGGTPNAFFTEVIALSDLPAQELREVWVNGELVTLDTENPVGRGYPVIEYRRNGVDFLWIKFHDGTQTAADSFLTDNVASASRPYDSNRVGYGIAYAICTARVNQELFTGFPEYKFSLYGAKLYDISKDTTAGGSGTQRWDNPATWGGDGDFFPAVQIYNILRGISYDGDWLYGAQRNGVGNLPAASWIAAVASNRTTVAAPGSTTEAQFRAGGQITVSNPIGDTIDALLSACHGRIAEIGGVYKLTCGNPGSSAVFSISDDRIISTEGQTFSPFFGLAESVNGITARYPEPTEGWAVKVAPPRYNAIFEAEDGDRRLLADVPLDYVPYRSQVQRIMKMALQEARRARRHTLTLPPEAQVLEPMDIIGWTSERNGYDAKLFRVDGVIDKSNLDVMVDVTEINPNDYDWDPDVDFEQPVFGPVVRPRPDPQAVVDWAATATTIKDASSKNRRAAIQLSWDGTVDDVKAVAFAVRLAASGATIHRGRTDEVDAGAIIITQSLLPNTAYEARGRYIPTGNNRETTWSSWLPVTTPDIRLTLPDFSAEIQELVRRVSLEAQQQVDNAINKVNSAVANLAAIDDANKDVLRRELRRETGLARASFTEQIELATGEDSAIGRLVTELEASVGDILANTKAEFVVGVTPGGAVASYELRTVAEDANAGLRVVAVSDGNGGSIGQVWVTADRFYVGKEGLNSSFKPVFLVVGNKVVIDGSLIASGSILGSNIKAGEIRANHIGAGEINAGHIEARTISVDKIVSNSIIQQEFANGGVSPNIFGPFQTVAEITARFNTGVLLIFCQFGTPANPDAQIPTAQIKVSNTPIAFASGSFARGQINSLIAMTTVSAGNKNIKFLLGKSNGADFSGCRMTVLGLYAF